LFSHEWDPKSQIDFGQKIRFRQETVHGKGEKTIAPNNNRKIMGLQYSAQGSVRKDGLMGVVVKVSLVAQAEIRLDDYNQPTNFERPMRFIKGLFDGFSAHVFK
jgi:hypothetical protein